MTLERSPRVGQGQKDLAVLLARRVRVGILIYFRDHVTLLYQLMLSVQRAAEESHRRLQQQAPPLS